MNHDDEVCLKLGREVVRMIRDIRKTAGVGSAYATRKLTFPGGEVYMLLANQKELIDLMHAAAEEKYAITGAIPPSQVM